MYPLWEKSSQKGQKVAKYSAKFALVCVWDTCETRKRRLPISVNSVCKDLYVLCAARRSGWIWQSTFWILAFAYKYGGSELSKNVCHDAKNWKNQTRSDFFYDWQKCRRQCVNVIDRTWGCIYFSTCEHFGRKFRTQCAMNVCWQCLYTSNI